MTRRWIVASAAAAVILAAGVFVACGGDDSSSASDGDAGNDATGDGSTEDAPAPAHTIAISFARGTGVINVTVHVESLGAPDSTTAPTLNVTNGTAGAITAGSAPGDFIATVTPSVVDDEVPVTASAYGVSVTRIAIVLTHVDDSLDQPEVVPGLVNTTGVEDGANVSPDGQWLVIASYVPIDLYDCANDRALMDASSCTTIIGPYGPPERPNMLGASRIHGTTFDSECPSFGLTAPQDHAFFPTAAYIFHRQPDGTFAEPHVLGVGADGCLGPYGYSFTDAPSGGSAGLVFAQDDPLDAPDMLADIYFVNITLGQDNIWGHYYLDGGVPTLADMTAVLVPPVLPQRQGNPGYANGILAWDDEDLQGGSRDLYYAPELGSFPGVTAQDAGTTDGGPPTLGVSTAASEEIQPSFDGDDVYWFGDTHISKATRLATTNDPGAPASWSAPTNMIGPKPDFSAQIYATGEPTVANVAGGKKELYFIYLKKTATGVDGAVGRVPFR